MEPHVFLKVDAFRLTLPQTDIRLLGMIGQLEVGAADGSIAGWYEAGDHRCPVFSTDEQLHPVNTITAQRRYCVLMAKGEQIFGLAVDDFQALGPDQQLDFHPAPACMSDAGSFIEQLAVLDGEIYGLTSAESLGAQFPLGEIS